METVKLLVVNGGTTPISTDKHVLPINTADDARKMQEFILTSLNRLGKMAHVLIKYKGEYWVADHTARKGPSKEYFKRQIKYHRYLKELA